MRELFKEFPEACDNTLRIAEMCEVEFPTADERANYMPLSATPSGEDEESWFVKEVQRGLEYRYPSGIPDEVQSRADYEVSVILKMGFHGYFLVVCDLLQWATEQGIRVGPERGCGGGWMGAVVT